MKQKHFIDFHKGITGLVVLLLMWYFERLDSPTAWVYAALHGSYGLLWVLKSQVFPDKNWEQPVKLPYASVILLSLSLYWIAPLLICWLGVEAPAWLLGIAVFIYGTGVFWHFASDMQKHTALELRRGLITTGLWARSRNPNYFGELLIYGSFAALSMHWLPPVILLVWVLAYWTPNMLRKDKSISRYPEFADYKKRSALIIPFII